MHAAAAMRSLFNSSTLCCSCNAQLCSVAAVGSVLGVICGSGYAKALSRGCLWRYGVIFKMYW
jgi:hypothetical protein